MKKTILILLLTTSVFSTLSFAKEPNGLFEIQQNRKERRINNDLTVVTADQSTKNPIQTPSEEKKCCC